MKKEKKQKVIAPENPNASATLRYLRIAPRKVRLVAKIIKNLPIGEAEAQMMLHLRRSAVPVLKLLRSAVANAKAKKLDVSKLFVKDIRVDNGPMLKRWIPRAQGRATPIHKSTSHIVILLQEGEKSVQSRFITEVKKVKKDKKVSEHKHDHNDHEHEHESAKKETKEKEVETKKDIKVQDKGFAPKIFRRKSI